MDYGLANGIYSNKLEGNATGLYDSIRTGLHNGIYNENIIDNGIVKNGLVLYLDAANPYSSPYGSTTWKDLSGNGNNATLVNGAYYNNENKGTIFYDGINDYANLGTSINFSNYPNGFTIGFWVKILDISQTLKYLYSKLTAGGIDNQFSIIYGYVANTFELYAGGAGANQNIRTNSQIVINDSNWHFLYYTVGARTIGYLDGQTKFINNYASLIFYSSTNFNYINTFATTTAFLNVSIANFIIYNRILSQSEINQNYLATKSRFNL